MKKYLSIFLLSLGLVSTLNTNQIFAENIESVNPIADNSMETTETEANTPSVTSTVNVRCYVPDTFYESEETVHVMIYGKNNENCYSFDLNPINDYFISQNIEIGTYGITAFSSNPDYADYRSESLEKQYEITPDPSDIAFAYGDEDFLEEMQKKLAGVDVYEDKTTSDVKENVPDQKIEGSSEEITTDTENSSTNITPFVPTSQKAVTTPEKKHYTFTDIVKIIFASLFLLVLMFLAFRRKKK